jgi:hypothetical protein
LENDHRNRKKTGTAETTERNKNGDTPLDCPGRAALRRKYCGVLPKSLNIRVRTDTHSHDNPYIGRRFLGNEYRTISFSAVTNMLAAVVSESRKLKYSTRCLLDRPTNGYNRPRGQEKLAELGELRRRHREEIQNR